ncbi:response regulator [Spirochaeta lutea]|uniref:Chemotaxis protein CheY n=1 Tax=Spirochaeta lutea TaxID=1480694 RepID=A0A098QW63_9SPIO|nr:response regulator [Spirochaeta lutea]KGE70742.1 chemotaxis protein CheY [Spirochaeta lutea]
MAEEKQPGVLIIDDLGFMRDLMAKAAESGGFAIAGTASNGREGVRSYVMLEPDLVLLDITMPVMDGITALKKILAYDPAARVVMCSTLSEESLIIRALQIGARDYIVKPFRPQRVVSALERARGKTGPGLGL